MPLPSALLARLQRRGIIQSENDAADAAGNDSLSNDGTGVSPNDDEEVIAEHKDDAETEKKSQSDSEENEENFSVKETPRCPNRNNPYHDCSAFCIRKWGKYRFRPNAKMLKKRELMLRRYPLPPGWFEVADPESCRFYYWNSLTDDVCWLSPVHPRARISLPIEKLRLDQRRALDAAQPPARSFPTSEQSPERRRSRSREDRRRHRRGRHRSRSLSSTSSDSGGDRHHRHHRRKHRHHRRRKRSSSEERRESLDPMDPASYSEAPRGTWNTGIERSGSKRAADSTASGTLFQARPYPTPGEILRSNKREDEDDQEQAV